MINTHSLNRTAEIALEATITQTEILMEAMTAAYALIAHADGELATSERRRLFAIIRDTPALSGFSHDDIAKEAAVHEANFRLDPELAQRIAWEKLEPVAGQRRAAHMVVAACREIIPADGVAHPSEYRVLATIKSRLGIDDLPPHI